MVAKSASVTPVAPRWRFDAPPVAPAWSDLPALTGPVVELVYAAIWPVSIPRLPSLSNTTSGVGGR